MASRCRSLGRRRKGASTPLLRRSLQVAALLVGLVSLGSVTLSAGAAGATGEISGTVFEDVAGLGNLSGAVASNNVTVLLYRDDGNGAPGAGDALVTTTTTTAGNYTFSALTDDTYWVAVDSKTVAPSAGLKVGFVQGDVWAEQTYGVAGSVGFDGSYTFSSSAGSFFGGARGSASDDASALATSEHVTRSSRRVARSRL